MPRHQTRLERAAERLLRSLSEEDRQSFTTDQWTAQLERENEPAPAQLAAEVAAMIEELT